MPTACTSAVGQAFQSSPPESLPDQNQQQQARVVTTTQRMLFQSPRQEQETWKVVLILPLASLSSRKPSDAKTKLAFIMLTLTLIPG
jgi:hypothetical protein